MAGHDRGIRRLTALAVGLAYSPEDDAACVDRLRREPDGPRFAASAIEELARWSLVDPEIEVRARRLLESVNVPREG